MTAAAPVQLLDLDWNRTFTSPQITDNRMSMVSLNGSVKATPELTFSGVGYYRWFQQEHVHGNVADDPQRCGRTVSANAGIPGTANPPGGVISSVSVK
jgi:iron complex outermembrane recepter protein